MADTRGDDGARSRDLERLGDRIVEAINGLREELRQLGSWELRRISHGTYDYGVCDVPDSQARTNDRLWFAPQAGVKVDGETILIDEGGHPYRPA